MSNLVKFCAVFLSAATDDAIVRGMSR
jgi:hypothetical protein